MGLSAEEDFDGIVTFESVMADAAALGLVRRGRPVVCKPADVAFRLALRAAAREVAKKKRKGKENGPSSAAAAAASLDPGARFPPFCSPQPDEKLQKKKKAHILPLSFPLSQLYETKKSLRRLLRRLDPQHRRGRRLRDLLRARGQDRPLRLRGAGGLCPGLLGAGPPYRAALSVDAARRGTSVGPAPRGEAPERGGGGGGRGEGEGGGERQSGGGGDGGTGEERSFFFVQEQKQEEQEQGEEEEQRGGEQAGGQVSRAGSRVIKTREPWKRRRRNSFIILSIFPFWRVEESLFLF